MGVFWTLVSWLTRTKFACAAGQDFSRFLHKFGLIMYSRSISELVSDRGHQRKPTQKLTDRPWIGTTSPSWSAFLNYFSLSSILTLDWTWLNILILRHQPKFVSAFLMVIEKTNTTDCLLDKIPRLRIDNIIAFLTFISSISKIVFVNIWKFWICTMLHKFSLLTASIMNMKSWLSLKLLDAFSRFFFQMEI